MVLPTALLFTTLIMSLFWCLPANAHMRSLRVVEVNDTAKFQLADFPGRDGHLVEPLAFEDAVGTLRDGIFQRVSTLGHANADAMLLELGYISVTTILAATIGMVDKPAGGLVTNRIQCHSKGLERVYAVESDMVSIFFDTMDMQLLPTMIVSYAKITMISQKVFP